MQHVMLLDSAPMSSVEQLGLEQCELLRVEDLFLDMRFRLG